MRFGSRANGFVKAFALVMSTSLSFAVAPNLMADEGITAVAQSSAPLNQLFSKQWVRLSADDSITGSLVQLADNDTVAMAGLPVSLVRNGEVAYSAVADPSGSFKFANVKTGSYSLVTRTNESIAAFSLQILDSRNTHLSSSVEVRVVRPAGLKVKEILRSQMLPLVAVRSDAQGVTKDPLGESRSFSKSQFVRLDASGKLLGQLASVSTSAKLSDMLVYVLRNGEEVARTRADAEGKFSLEGLRPGIYGFVAAGGAGFAATSFQLIGGSIASDGSKLISSNMGDACGQMNVEVVQCCEVAICEQPIQTVVETVVAQTPVVDPFAVPVDGCGAAPSCGCGGGFGGGFGGGGGGGLGGGIGGLGGIAAIAGLATVAAIVAANDDNDDAGVTSPIQ